MNIQLTKEQAAALSTFLKDYYSYDEIPWESAQFRDHAQIIWAIDEQLKGESNV